MEQRKDSGCELELLFAFLIMQDRLAGARLELRMAEVALIERHGAGIQIRACVRGEFEVIVRRLEHFSVCRVQIEVDQLPPADRKTVSQWAALQVRIQEWITEVLDSLAVLFSHLRNRRFALVPELSTWLELEGS